MRLKKITLCGFKSFADKTEIAFDAPIVCIVGPNGCGKSNVVDAIKWVLGEQSAKSLRGGAMLDVIFNGSSTRKPSGVASVGLTFDNTDRNLQLDFDTVTVTRRLYRDGSSEYLLNNQTCRLRDIRELFMDTGVGADAYSIIEQGKVDVLLQANPQQRRELFEEAAGISRFKARKLEASRKLERTEQNLGLAHQRLEDTHRRLRSVKAQASRARSYQEVSAQLRDLQLAHTLAQYHKLQTQHQELQQNLQQLQTQRTTTQQEAQTHQDDLDQAQHNHRNLVTQQQQIQHERAEKRSVVEQAQKRRELAESALADLRQRIELDRDQQDQLTQRAKQLQEEFDSHKDQSRQLEAHQEEINARLKSAHEQHRQLSDQINAKRAALEDEKAGIIDLMRHTAKLHNEVQSLGQFQENLLSAREKIDHRASHVTQQLESLLCNRDQAQQKHHEAQSLLETQRVRAQEYADQLAKLKQQQRDLGQRLAETQQQHSALSSRRALLQEMQDKQQGLADPIKAILAYKQTDQLGLAQGQEDRFRFVRGLLAQMIETDPDQPDHARLAEAALGHYQQALVVEQLADLCPSTNPHRRDVLDTLTGRVMFLPLDQFPLAIDADHDHTLPPEARGCQRVSDLVRCPKAVKPIVDHLLGRTLLAADLETAVSLRGQLAPGYRFVTPTGTLLEVDGRVTMGPAADDADTGGGLISRRGELARLQRQITQFDQTIATLQQELSQADARATHIEQISQQLNQSIYETNADRVELASRLESLEDQIKQRQREQPVLAAETEQIHRQLRDAQQKRKTREDEATKLEADSAARQQMLKAMQEEIDRLAEGLEKSQESITAIRVEAGRLGEQLGAVRRQNQQIQVAQADIDRQLKTLAQQRDQQHHRVEELEQAVFDANKQTQQAKERLSELEVRDELMTHQLEQSATRVEALQAKLSQQQQLLEGFEQQAHRCEVTQRELEVKTEALVQRSQEQLGVAVAEAYQSYDHQEIDWAAVEDQIQTLRTKLDRLGTVNLNAIEEQDELERTSQELGQQVQDIESARSQLQRLIHQINDDSRKRFVAMFDQLRENFAGRDGLFRRLFGGGRADLVLLADEDGKVDVLESGIDIIAKPPGKEPQSIRLLSGGEKTMTAVALLMSIFKAKPSPFCVLDEVDAALDESNLERFSGVIQSFLDRSHFVVITHQKRTMEVADQLYGITMEERGVSKRVAVKFEQVQADGRITPEPVESKPKAKRTAKAPTRKPVSVVLPTPQAEVDDLKSDQQAQPQPLELEPVAAAATQPTFSAHAQDEVSVSNQETPSMRDRLAQMLNSSSAVEVEAE